MAVALNPKYRNKRKNFYTDKGTDSQAVGSIVQVLKSVSGSYDHSYVPVIVAQSGTTAYDEISGDAAPEDNPEYQYEGYIYCDGREFYIKDYPALYEIIGNEYGGVASDGIDVVTGGTGYSGTLTVTISAPPSGLFPGITAVQATGEATAFDGIITGVEVLNPGKGYDPSNPPTVTVSGSGGGSGATFAVRINEENGQIQGITKDNVWSYWPEDMGTFKIPDLKAKRIVGNGPVYGSNSANVGNSELGVGLNTIDGKWYMDKDAQKGMFALGNISTIGYTDVVDTVEASIVGSQVVTVQLQPKKLAGAPQHTHFLLHAEAPQDTNYPLSVSGERYLVSYKASTGKVNNFLPPGGIAYSHTHVLSKAPILDASVSTYDIYNWSGGDQNSGSLKEADYYYASGGAGAGSYQQITTIGTPNMKKFNSSSAIGGRTVTTNGVPIFESEETTYSSAGSYTLAVPADVSQATVTLIGGGGSGAVYTTQGNNGGASTFTAGSVLTVSAGGGTRGNASSTTTGGTGGSYGGYSISGSISGNIVVVVTGSPDQGDGGDGGNGPVYNGSLENPNNNPGLGGAAGTTPTGINGSAGVTRQITDSGSSESTFTYSSGTSQDYTIAATNANYTLTGVSIELAGAGGANCGNFGGNGCGAAGAGGAGKWMRINLNSNYATSGTVLNFQPGQFGLTYNGQADAAHSGKGGRAGDGYGSNDGGGGGAATLVRLSSGNIIIAGAGGGGGGGGYGEGVCGQNGNNAGSPGDAVIETTEALFTGGGATGGGYGCTGGGGGGGGGGCARSGDTAGGNPGSGGGGSGGHEEGYGGQRGLSAVRTTYATLQNSANTNTGDGYVKVTVSEDRGYWTAGGGGGGAGGFVTFIIQGSDLSGISSVSTVVGEGGAGVSNGGTSSSAGSDGYAKIKFQKIVGYEGGTESITIGDVFEAGSGDQDNGVNFYASGTGTNASNGFKLPTTQTPTVVFEGGGGGSGATASATVSGNKITSLTLTNAGSGYTEIPRVRILGGAGVRNHATVGLNVNNGTLQGLTLQNSEEPTTYLKFGGTQQTRYVTTNSVDASEILRVTVKAARGNGKNGGDLPENGGDELLLYYNTDNTDNFPGSNFLGALVPIPTASQINSDFDGTGTGTNPTNWYTYGIELPEAAQTENVKFQIRQARSNPTGANDNASNTDNYAIMELTYEYKQTTELVFVASEGKIPVADDIQQYNVEGAATATYTSGIFANDLTLTLSSSNPIIPVASLDPDRVIPLIEPYFLVKYLIKAF
ncbi:MAG: tail fiber protein [Candidatus Nanopelagicaceae bacterium]